MGTMICLLGEQAVPNLLPIRHYKPTDVLFLWTDRTDLQRLRLTALVSSEVQVHAERVADPYDLAGIRGLLQCAVAGRGWETSQLLLNLTGGTKPMAYAAFDLAKEWQAPFCYLQTEGKQSVVYEYTWCSEGHALSGKSVLPPDLLQLDSYLRLHVGTYKSEVTPPREVLEPAVVAALRSCQEIDEVLRGVRPDDFQNAEMDFVVRCGSQFGVGEVKQRAKKQGIDQLNAVAEQRVLGTYVSKFLVCASAPHHNHKQLAKAYGIEIIQVDMPSSGSTTLSLSSRETLCRQVVQALRGRSSTRKRTRSTGTVPGRLGAERLRSEPRPPTGSAGAVGAGR